MGMMEHFTREQTIQLLARAKASRERDWVLFLVAFCHGLRASEAINLTPANFSDGYLGIKRLKGSKKTVQPLREERGAAQRARGHGALARAPQSTPRRQTAAASGSSLFRGSSPGDFSAATAAMPGFRGTCAIFTS